jgi:hypothetical protein
METHHHASLARRRLLVALLGAAALVLAAPHAAPAKGAPTKTRTFRATKVKRGVATFRLRLLVPKSVRSARLKYANRKRRVSVRRVRAGARRGKLRLRLKKVHHRRVRRAKLIVVVEGDGRNAAAAACGSSTDWGSFHVGSWPGSCTRPFSDDSPWNRGLTSTPTLQPRSTQMVARLMAGGRPNALRAGIADTPSDYYKPTYYSTTSDPLYTVKGTYRHSGEQLRIPEGARSSGSSDHHMTVVTPDGKHWGFWNAKVDNSAHTISGADGGSPTTRVSDIYGLGIGGDGGNGLGECGSTAAGFCNLAGIIRAQELEGGVVDHALFATSSQIANSYVYPAASTGDGPSAAGDYPPMGTRFQLDPSFMTDARIITYPRWEQPILRALRDYGMYLGDNSGAASFALQFESGSTYTSFGYEDEMVKFARSVGAPSYSESGRTIYSFDLGNVDWARYLRVVDPCVTQGTCSGSTSVPPPAPDPTPTSTPPPPANTAPTVQLTAPVSGATIDGRLLTMSAAASDDKGVARVEFYVDGKRVATDSSAPYDAAWRVPKGWKPGSAHTVTATAFDAEGLSASASATVTKT